MDHLSYPVIPSLVLLFGQFAEFVYMINHFTCYFPVYFIQFFWLAVWYKTFLSPEIKKDFSKKIIVHIRLREFFWVLRSTLLYFRWRWISLDFLYLGKNRLIGLVARVFANGLGDLDSIPGRVIPKTLKMVLDTSLLNTQYYKVQNKGKVEQSRERGSALPYTLV